MNQILESVMGNFNCAQLYSFLGAEDQTKAGFMSSECARATGAESGIARLEIAEEDLKRRRSVGTFSMNHIVSNRVNVVESNKKRKLQAEAGNVEFVWRDEDEDQD